MERTDGSKNCRLFIYYLLSGEEIAELAKEKPDIILMDIQMETEKAGITATKIIKEKYPDIKIIIIIQVNETLAGNGLNQTTGYESMYQATGAVF